MSVTRITPDEAAARMEAGDAACLDVRSVREFEQGHPPGAINVPLADHHPATGMMMPNPRFLEAVLHIFDKDTSIIVACAAGGRSLRAATMMAASGFTDVTDMRGGFSGKMMPPVEPGWIQRGLPVSTEGEAWVAVQARLEE